MPETPAQLRLLFGYLPESYSLHDWRNRPRLPEALIPLAYVEVNESISPDGRETVQVLVKADVLIKFLSEDAPERVIGLAKDRRY